MTPRAIEKAIAKLHLEEGDIIVVKNIDVLKALVQMKPPPGAPACPVLYAPDGVDKVDRAALIALISELDSPELEKSPALESKRIISTEA